jgi:hypothetical protein
MECAQGLCLLCGSVMQSSYRIRTVANVQAILCGSIKSTPFAWQCITHYLSTCCLEDTVQICAPCSQWFNRTQKQTGPCKRPPMLLVDQLIMATLMSKYSFIRGNCMQARIYNRVLKALQEKDNFLYSSCPLLTRRMLQMMSSVKSTTPVLQIIQCWWRLHGCPQLLPNAHVARAVRMMQDTTAPSTDVVFTTGSELEDVL